eukprot:INCI7219.1.p1 GENE.INCI7219.1~~INCI7219.1.p1  ORF type:complete len:196 (-),score=24.83 INCI7219.1:197-751(-)
MSPFDNREACRQGYLDHNQRVRDVTPSDQLLEFNVKQGWEPLCSFLEVPTAECPSTRGLFEVVLTTCAKFTCIGLLADQVVNTMLCLFSGIEFPRVNQRDANKTIYSVSVPFSHLDCFRFNAFFLLHFDFFSLALHRARIIAYGYPFLPLVPFFVAYLVYKIICCLLCRGRPEIGSQQKKKKTK